MKKLIATTLLGAILASSLAPLGNAADAPCEDTLKQLREKEGATSISDTNKASYEDLKAQGIERCNADDDKRANDFFAQAMALLGQ